MASFADSDPSDLKLIYRVLHAHVMDHPDLLDSPFFEALQRHLQTLARADQVDLADHAQWDAWLGVEPTSCDERMARRRLF